MDEKRNEELKQLWQSLILLGDELDRKDLEKVLLNYNKYKQEIMLMAKLRYIGKLKSTYPTIYEFIQRDAGEIIAMIQDISLLEEKSDEMRLGDYAKMFSEEIKKREIMDKDALEEIKVFIPRGKEIGD